MAAIKTKTICGFDVETSKIPNHFPWFEGHYLSLVSTSRPDNTCRTWVFIHDENKIDVAQYQKQLLEIEVELNKYDIIAAHNLKFDRNILRELNLTSSYHCTMVGEYLLNHQSRVGLKLDDLCTKYKLPLKIDKVKLMWDSGMDSCEIPLSIFIPYCEEDARKTRLIAEKQQKLIMYAGLAKIFSLQMDWLDLLSAMECNGILWDMKRARQLVTKYTKYSTIITQKVLKIIQQYVPPGINPQLTSGDDLSAIIYGGKIKRKEKCSVIKQKNVKVRMPYIFKYKNGTQKIKVKTCDHVNTNIIRRMFKDVWYDVVGLGITPLPKSEISKSTDELKYYKTGKNVFPMLKTVTLHQKLIIALLSKLSSVNKVITTFINSEKKTGLMNKIGIDGKLHTNYNQTVTATGRLSSSNPNSQNLPRGNTSPIKQCFLPTLGNIINADLSQIEWRVPAFLSQDTTMIKEINSGIDQHGSACTTLMGLPLNKPNRFYAKIFNFRMIFRGTAWGFFKDPNMPKFSIKKWEQIVKDFYKKYFKLKIWQDKNIQHVIDGNGTLSVFTGRTFKFFLKPYNGKYNESEVANYPVQGTAGDILFFAAIIIWNSMKKANMKALPILTVHDSLVFDCPDNEVDRLADLCMRVFNNLPTYINKYWGIKWNVNLTGEIELGPNYGQMKRIR